MKKLVALMLAVTVSAVIVLAGCFKKDESPSALTQTVTTKPAKLRISWWGSQSRHDYTLKLLDMYSKRNQNITLEPEYTSYDEYTKKYIIAAAANNLPDIFQYYVSVTDSDSYFKTGRLEPLDKYVQSKLLNLSDCSASAVDTGRMTDGKLYGVAQGVNARTLIIDPAIYEKAGIKVPDDTGYTWEQYEKDAITITQKLGIYGSGEIERGSTIEIYLREKGQHLVNQKDPTKIDFTADNVAEFFKMKLRIQEAKAAPTSDFNAQVKGNEDLPIISGKAATAWKPSSSFAAISAAAKRPLKMILLPGPNQDIGMYVQGGMHWTVPTSSKSKEEAIKFINWITNDIEANKLIIGDRGIPIASKVREALKPLLNANQKAAFDYIDMVAKNSTAMDGWAQTQEMVDLLKDIEEKILFKKITPEAGAKEYTEKMAQLAAKTKP